MSTKNPTILCIDDDEDDLHLLQYALNQLPQNYHLITAHNGMEGLEQLNKLQEAKDLPCLIILDLNMPKMNGKETFLEIQKNKELSKVPVVIFSTSSNPKDQAYFSSYNIKYFVKPVNLSHFTEVTNKMLNDCKH